MIVNFSFSLPENKGVEYLYEYVISHSEDYFGIPSTNILYTINSEFDCFYIVAAYNSVESPNLYLDQHIKDIKMEETNNSFGRIFINSQKNNITIKKGHPLLCDCEIRYIKYSQSRLQYEISKILYMLVNRELKCKTHDADILFDRTQGTINYSGRINKHSFLKKVLIRISEDDLEKLL